VFKTFHSDDGISYQELDSTENAELYTEDDVVEVFIRANSGGTRLGKSDLLFSLLSSSWDRADEQMEDLLSDLNRHGFSFTRDFVLKSCLTLLNQGARYEVSKFRKPGVREEIETRWQDITKALKDVLDFVRGKTFIRCDKALPSYLVLIPLVYSRYHFPDNWKAVQGIDNYLLRALISGAFSGTPDQLIDDCVGKIKEQNGFDMNHLFDAVQYLACFLDCVICGGTETSDMHRPNVKRILEENPALRYRIESARKGDAADNLFWEPEADRARNVILKLARGHAAYELYPKLEKPSIFGFAPLQILSDDQRSAFEQVAGDNKIDLWPEIGSRAFLRAYGKSPDRLPL
jgi:hypothetical protein